MSVIDTLITDRTGADLSELEALLAKPLATWTEEELSWFNNSKSKGAYDYTDLNRVTEAMEYLNGILNEYGYITGYEPVMVADGRIEWQKQDEPTEAKLSEYLRNIEKLRSVLELLPNTPDTPADMDGMTIQEANAIKQILSDINTIIIRVLRSFIRSGAFTAWSGNRPLPSAESNMGRTWAEQDALHTTWRQWQAADWYLLVYGNLIAEEDVA